MLRQEYEASYQTRILLLLQQLALQSSLARYEFDCDLEGSNVDELKMIVSLIVLLRNVTVEAQMLR
jgi:hypothetical protein